ncbi:MAG: hypothetical protein ACTH31_08935, partial [Pseudoclavibacter sp.]
ETTAPEYLTDAEVANRVPTLTTQQLKKHAHLGTGPEFTPVGRQRIYDWADVVAWMKANRTTRTDRFGEIS